jgi:acyl transferase domain-containing protein
MTGIPEPERVAIIGMAGRFPGAGDVESFWRMLKAGTEGLSTFDDDQLRAAGVSPADLAHPGYVRAKGVLDGADEFDAGFFGISPREAEVMDPQHRLFLEAAWEALEDAGRDPATFPGRIGVFAGSSLNTYLLFNIATNPGAVDAIGRYQTLLASDKDFLPTRVSYRLNLRGPSINVQTACSTSLVAVHLACQSLLAGECDIALAGGVSVSTPLRSGYRHETGGILSSDGHCRTFDARADGTVGGNGVAIVVLRRLGDALAEGDRVDAVICGSAINNDGSTKVGYTAPSVDGQAEVITEALAVAGVEPDEVSYIEAHGTGTRLGDPIEVAALTRAFRTATDRTGFCAIGSVKSNVGHLDAAAGATALVKTVLALDHEGIPPTIHYGQPNPELALEASPFVVASTYRPWPRGSAPRRAGVSSFGIGGTNAHLIVQEGPLPAARRPGRPNQVLTVSARSADAVAAAADRLARHLEGHPDTDLSDVAFTLSARRRAFDHRRAVICADRAEAVERLRQPAPAVRVAGTTVPVAFLFPGQGAQYVDMAGGLYREEPTFRAEFDQCAEAFAEHLDLHAVVFPAEGTPDAADRLARTEFTQPAVFAVEYALAQLWQSWGVRPAAMLGHSIGEYVAACLSGVFSLRDAARLVAARGRLVQSMPPGAMLAVFGSQDAVAGWLDGELSVAAVNSPTLTVLSGPVAAVDALQERLSDRGQPSRRLHTSHAFHSPMMAAAVAPFLAEFRGVALNPPRIPFLSNVTGTWITDEQATDPAYWGAHLRQPVRFADGLTELLRDPALVTLEVGPGRTLTPYVRDHRSGGSDRTAATSTRAATDLRDDQTVFLEALGSLWQAGVTVDWPAVYAGQARRVVRLPGYPFERQRYWVEPGQPTAPDPPARRFPDIGDWFSCPGWRRVPLSIVDAGAADWLLLGADTPLGQELARRLAGTGGRVACVAAGESFVATGEARWSVDPTSRADHVSLLAALREAGLRPTRAVHLWSLAASADDAPDDRDQLDHAVRLGFHSLLALGQALADTTPGPVAIDVITQGGYSVTGTERLLPGNATVAGPCTVIPQEVPGVTCRRVDIDPAGPAQCAALAEFLRARVDGTEFARRGNNWWVRDFEPLRVPSGRSPARDGGVYLITGGLGGVGLSLAEHLAGTARGPVLALLSRTGLPADEEEWTAAHEPDDPTSARIRAVARLRALGARPVVLAADVTNAEQVVAAVHRVRTEFGGVKGVVHAAGLPAGGLLRERSPDDADRVLAVKTVGTLNLYDACQGEALDFFVLCSSVTSVLGGPGQVDYCAANAYLDAFAESRRASGAPITSIGWDTWRGIGMAADLSGRLDTAAHPLLGPRVDGPGEVYVSMLDTATSWIVDEHRIMGHGLVPGTAYLEMVRAAVAQRAGGRAIELRDVLFTVPLIVPDGRSRRLYLSLEQDGDGLRFQVRSRTPAGGWLPHAEGTVSFVDSEPYVARPIAAVLADCQVTEVLEAEGDLRRRLRLDRVEEGGPIRFAFGPRWRCLRRIDVGRNGLVATLSLPPEYEADLAVHRWHPALLDVAGAAARIHAGDGYYLPFWYGSLRIVRDLTPEVACVVRLKESGDRETLTCDVDLLDPDGELLGWVRDFTMKRINDVDALIEQIEAAASAGSEPDTPATSPALAALRALGEGISAAEAMEVFDRIVSTPGLPAHVVVSSRSLSAMRRLIRDLDPVRLAAEAEQLALPATSHPRPALDTDFVAATTEAELGIASIWQEVLGVDGIGIHDDFFALGGDSLAAVQIGAKIRARFGVELALRDFFDRPTVANAATVLAASTDSPAPVGTGPIQRITREDPDDEDDLSDLTDEEIDTRLRELLRAPDANRGSGR